MTSLDQNVRDTVDPAMLTTAEVSSAAHHAQVFMSGMRGPTLPAPFLANTRDETAKRKHRAKKR